MKTKVSLEHGLLVPQQLEDPGLLRRERVPLLADRVLLAHEGDHALLEAGGQAQAAELGLDAVGELLKGAALQK